MTLDIIYDDFGNQNKIWHFEFFRDFSISMDFVNMKFKISIDFLIKHNISVFLYMGMLPDHFLWLRGLTNNVLSDAKWI